VSSLCNRSSWKSPSGLTPKDDGEIIRAFEKVCQALL
jgi:hypothetical protein